MLYSTDLSTRAEVMAIPTPVGTRTHKPVGHGDLINRVEMTLAATSPEFGITQQEFEITHGGGRMLSMWTLSHALDADYHMAIGLKNAHDKAFSLGISFGARVDVCANGMFTGEHVTGRKHTVNIHAELASILWNILSKLGGARDLQEAQFNRWKGRILSDTEAHDLTIKAMDRGVYSASQIGKVLNEYRNPQHEEFESRTAWAFSNAVTECQKSWNNFDMSNRTSRLAGLLDEVAPITPHMLLASTASEGNALN